MYWIRMSMQVDASDLADDLAYGLDREDLLDFVLAVEEQVADLEFTKELRDRLNEIIAECEAEEEAV